MEHPSLVTARLHPPCRARRNRLFSLRLPLGRAIRGVLRRKREPLQTLTLIGSRSGEHQRNVCPALTLLAPPFQTPFARLLAR